MTDKRNKANSWRISLGSPHVSRTEWLLCKLLFAWFVLKALPLDPLRLPSGAVIVPGGGRIAFETQPKPNGIAQYFDLSWIGEPSLQPALWGICGVALLAYVFTRWELVALVPLLFITVVSRTLFNSQGFVHHGYQIFSLILLAQTIVLVWGRCRRHQRPADRANLFAASQAAIVACYVIAGITKLFESGRSWFTDSHLLALDTVKTHRQSYYNALDPAELEGFQTLVPWILEHNVIARIGFGAGVVLELVAFVALFGRRYALAMGVALIAFHQITDWSMGLSFKSYQVLDLVFLVAPQFWLLLAGVWIWNRNRGQGDDSLR